MQIENLIEEVQFLAYFIPVMLGVELSVYFFIQYAKTRDTQLKLNRILLSYGTFTFLIIIGALIEVTVRLYFTQPDGTRTATGELWFKIGFIMICLTPIGFLGFIAINDFKELMNLKVVRLLLVLSIIPIIVMFTIGTSPPWFPISIGFTAINAIYLIWFQVRMIQKTMGDVKIRFTRLLVGELIALSSLIFAMGVVFGEAFKVLLFFIGVFVLTTGLLIMFIAANNFPKFYEFDWKFNLLRLFIIDATYNEFLYAHNFKKNADTETQDNERDDLFTGAISGIDDIISTITDSKTERISKIEQEDSYIILEYGGTEQFPIIYALLVEKDLASMNGFVNTVKRQFEAFFKDILYNIHEIEDPSKINQFLGSFDITLSNLINI